MRRGTATALVVVAAAALPAVLLGTALWVLLNPWLVHAQYALPGFPAARIALSDAQRADLAILGVRAVRPQTAEGVDLLRRARLPGGRPAFDAREIRHMADVRRIVRGFLIAWAVGVLALLAAGLALRRAGPPGALARALVLGSLLTLGGLLALALLMLASFDAFFDGFHGVFFTGDTWRFAPDDTLRSLYPDAFWAIGAGVTATLVLGQALLVWVLARRSMSG